jgi:hypothetical protein
LARIFAVRNVELWKVSDVQAWLLQCVEHAAEVVEAVHANDASEATLALHDTQFSYSDAVTLTKCNYPASKVNAFSFVDITHLSDTRPQLDPAQIAGMQHEGAALPDDGDRQDAAHLMQLVDQMVERAQNEQVCCGALTMQV